MLSQNIQPTVSQYTHHIPHIIDRIDDNSLTSESVARLISKLQNQVSDLNHKLKDYRYEILSEKSKSHQLAVQLQQAKKSISSLKAAKLNKSRSWFLYRLFGKISSSFEHRTALMAEKL